MPVLVTRPPLAPAPLTAAEQAAWTAVVEEMVNPLRLLSQMHAQRKLVPTADQSRASYLKWSAQDPEQPGAPTLMEACIRRRLGHKGPVRPAQSKATTGLATEWADALERVRPEALQVRGWSHLLQWCLSDPELMNGPVFRRAVGLLATVGPVLPRVLDQNAWVAPEHQGTCLDRWLSRLAEAPDAAWVAGWMPRTTEGWRPAAAHTAFVLRELMATRPFGRVALDDCWAHDVAFSGATGGPGSGIDEHHRNHHMLGLLADHVAVDHPWWLTEPARTGFMTGLAHLRLVDPLLPQAGVRHPVNLALEHGMRLRVERLWVMGWRPPESVSSLELMGAGPVGAQLESWVMQERLAQYEPPVTKRPRM